MLVQMFAGLRCRASTDNNVACDEASLSGDDVLLTFASIAPALVSKRRYLRMFLTRLVSSGAAARSSGGNAARSIFSIASWTSMSAS